MLSSFLHVCWRIIAGTRYMLIAGTFLHVLGLMMTGISKTYYQILLSQAVCSAIVATLLFSPAILNVCPSLSRCS